MIDLEAIRAALVDSLSQVGIETSWFAYPINLGAGNYPAGMITYAENDIVYDETMDGSGAVYLDIELHVRAPVIDAQKTMDRYLSRGTETLSVFDAIDLDSTLGGLVMSCVITSASVAAPPVDDTGDYVALVHLRLMP